MPQAEALRVWLRVAALSFGGPAGQIATMHRILVEETAWIDERRFLHALSYCTLLPGPEAQQLATYLGWLLGGTRGGIIAGGLFILPGMAAIMALSVLYVGWGRLDWVAGLFFGLKAAVLAIVIAAVRRLAARALAGPVPVAIATLAFLAIFLLRTPFPLIVAAASGVGAVTLREAGPVDAASPLPHRGVRPALRVAAIWLTLWLAPVLALRLWRGGDDVFSRLALFFSKLALVSFGGAYAALAYAAQETVQGLHWLSPAEMLDGLGMAETTPGPLIMVTQFVGFLAAYRQAGGMFAGVLGGLLTSWVIFTPCFLWIFLGAPYVEALRGNRTLSGALRGVTAAVVGVIVNLAVWFALHAWFAAMRIGGLGLEWPVWSSLRFWPFALSLLAILAAMVARIGAGALLAGGAFAGIALRLGLGIG